MSDPQLLRDIIRESLDVIIDPSYPQEFRDEIRAILQECKDESESIIIEFS